MADSRQSNANVNILQPPNSQETSGDVMVLHLYIYINVIDKIHIYICIYTDINTRYIGYAYVHILHIYTFIAFPHAWNLTISRFNSSTVLPSHMPCLKVSIHYAIVSQQWLVADQIYIIANSFVSGLMYLRGSGKFI